MITRLPARSALAAMLILASTLTAPVAMAATCPDWLDHDLRRLHSQDTVNLCEVAGGKPMLVVNTASHCGFTSQFRGLEALYQKYRSRGLAVVGFASNDFRQAAKSEEEAAQICYVNFGVSFTMVAPSAVTGADANPVFQAINRQSQPPGWNFLKYLLDASGNVVARFPSTVTPDDPELNEAIDNLLAEAP